MAMPSNLNQSRELSIFMDSKEPFIVVLRYTRNLVSSKKWQYIVNTDRCIALIKCALQVKSLTLKHQQSHPLDTDSLTLQCYPHYCAFAIAYRATATQNLVLVGMIHDPFFFRIYICAVDKLSKFLYMVWFPLNFGISYSVR